MAQMIEEPIPGNLLSHDLGGERAVLAAVLLDNSRLELVNQRLDVGDFFLDGHRSILQFMNDLAGGGNRIDAASLKSELTARGLPLAASGLPALVAAVEKAPPPGNLEPYFRALKRKAQEREFIGWLDTAHSSIAAGQGCETVMTEAERFITHFHRLTVPGVKGFYPSLADFFDSDIREPETIVAGLRRGEVAELAAVTNQGTSTLLLNLGLSLAAGQAYAPLLPESSPARRVLYLDCESSASRLRSDLQVMLRQIAEPQTAKANFMPVVDAEIDGLPLNLSREAHLQYLETVARDFHADLLIIDTVASAFDLLNEKANAEISRRVMNPLKLLARRLNCAILFAHHLGKENENPSAAGAYRGRGGSALGGLSSTVYTMEQARNHEPGYSVLTCAKSKGEMPAPVVIRLDVERRWFAVCDERPAPNNKFPTAEEVAAYVKGRGQAHTAEIVRHFAERASPRKIADCIKEASLSGLLEKGRQKTPWRVCTAAARGEVIDGVKVLFEEDLAAERAGGVKKGAETQKYTKYIIMEKKEPKVCRCGVPGIRFTNCEACGKFL